MTDFYIRINADTVREIASRLYKQEHYEDEIDFGKFHIAMRRWLREFVTENIVPDLDWWINERSSPSLDRLVNQLKLEKGLKEE